MSLSYSTPVVVLCTDFSYLETYERAQKMAAQEPYETTNVIICGCGPTGALLSAYLGRASVHNVVLEREPEITTDPRGIVLDEDGIRLLQGLGIYDQVFTNIGSCIGTFNFIGGTEKSLAKAPFMTMDYNTSEGGTGHPGFICHRQPVLEKHIRQSMANTGHSDLRVNSTILSISEDEDWVYSTYVDKEGQEHRIRGKFLVGADGKTGFTRKHYLEPRGIHMDKAHRLAYEETWVAVNMKLSLPSQKSHPNFPLWRLGYSPLDVYEAFFPKDFRFLCNPERPAVCGRFGLPTDRFWRFEFVVQKGESGVAMAEEKNMKRIVMPYLTHSGSRYSLTSSIQYPSDCIEVMRSRPFTFSARSCNKWALGRVILCGDAAHVFPPFGGQGIASGFRDASALAWRLVVACRCLPSPHTRNTSTPGSLHTRLLTGWYVERKQQLEQSLAATVENGAYVCESNRLKIFIRNWYLWAIQLVPTWKHWLEMGQRREGIIRYAYEEGVAFPPNLGGGFCFPQVYCISLAQQQHQQRNQQSQTERQQVFLTDDVIFASHKRAIFQVVALCPSLDTASAVHAGLQSLDADSDGELSSVEVTYIILDLHADATSLPDSPPSTSLFRIASADEFARSPLCVGRPKPLFYDPFRLWKEARGNPFLVLRPDRFVFAACKDMKEIGVAAGELVRLLKGTS